MAESLSAEAKRTCVTGSVLKPWRTRRRTRRGTKGRIVRHICCVELTSASRHKVSDDNNNLSRVRVNFHNLIAVVNNGNAVEGNSNVIQSVKYSRIPVIVRPRGELGEIVPRSTTNFRNLHVIGPSTFVQKVEEPLSVCCLNVQSLRNKVIPVVDYVVSHGFNVLALTETWRGNVTDQLVISELVPNGYEFRHVPRANHKRGGGIGIMYRSGLTRL